MKNTGLIENLRVLSELFGPSGKEDRVRKYIEVELDSHVGAIEHDFIGNLYLKKGKGKPRVLLCAHMDEVGFIIKTITSDGYLKFEPLGGINADLLPGKEVVFENGRKGVIGYKPVHLQKKNEKERKLSFDDLVIDIGMDDKKDVEKYFSPGDYAVFDTRFETLRAGYLKGKAFDDRVGCAIIMEIMKKFSPDFEIYALFSVQEELGLRGAKIGGERVSPDICLVVEGTAAGDFYQEGREDFPYLGKGPVLTIIDRSCMVDKSLLSVIEKIARENRISFQYKKPLIGGTDAGMVQIAGKGTPVMIVSVPVRYIHSPVSILLTKDVENAYFLCLKFLKEVKSIWKNF